MNSKAKAFIRNFSYTLTSNLVSLLISTLVILIVPKLIGVEEYGYWQLYLFYETYIVFSQFGWNEGVYLRYGGARYSNLDKELFFSQFWMLVFLQIVLALIIFLGASFFIRDIDRQFIFKMIALCMVVMGARNMLGFILQATNRIREYAIITIMARIIYCCLIIIFLVFEIREYKLMVVADLIGRTISLLYAMYCCRDITFRNITTFYLSFKEAFKNISVGMKLMFSNIASMMIIGGVRFGIERSWDVKTFGKISLSLSISNLMMFFINAVGIMMFPILRRTDEKKLPNIYITMRDILMIILFAALLLYYPLKFILLLWLPKYEESLKYMVLIFPMCIYEGKMALIVNSYLKTLRKEKVMLKINIISFLLSIMITFITTFLIKSLNLAVLSIVILLAFRCGLAENFLSKTLKITIYKDMILELLMIFVFILIGWIINSWFAALVYMLAYIIYFFIKRKDIINSIKEIKLLLKN